MCTRTRSGCSSARPRTWASATPPWARWCAAATTPTSRRTPPASRSFDWRGVVPQTGPIRDRASCRRLPAGAQSVFPPIVDRKPPMLLKSLLRLLTVTLLASSAAAQNPPIVVHHIGPFTGVLAASNKESIDGANLFLEGFNARGGVQGRPVKLETLDDGQDPKRAKALFDELLKKKPLALLLPRTTPSMEAMLPAVTQ